MEIKITIGIIVTVVTATIAMRIIKRTMTSGSIVVQNVTDRQTDMDGPLRCSSLTPV
jgi:hypothetical protein